MEIKFEFKAETKTCYRFEHGSKPELQTLYLKKDTVHSAGIDARKGIIVAIKEA